MKDNKYLRALEGTPESDVAEVESGVKGNKYLDTLNGVESTVKRSVFAGTQKDTDVTALAAKLSRESGHPMSLVAENVNRFSLSAKRLRIESFVTQNPETVDLFGNPEFVARTHDDLATAEGVSKALKEKGFRRLSVERRKADNVEELMSRYGELTASAANTMVKATGADYEQALPFGNNYAAYVLETERAGGEALSVGEWYTKATGKPFEAAGVLDDIKSGWHNMRAGSAVSSAYSMYDQYRRERDARVKIHGENSQPTQLEENLKKAADLGVAAAMTAMKDAGALPTNFKMGALQESDSITEYLNKMAKDPSLLVDIWATSAAPSATTLAGGAAGAIVGRAAGSSALKYLGLGGVSSEVNRASRVLEKLVEAGVDPMSAESLFGAFENEKLMSSITAGAMRYGLGIGAVDALSLGAAGVKLSPKLDALAGAVGGKYAKGATEVMSQLVAQAGLGGTSEILGEYLDTGKPARPADVLNEMLGETITLPGDIAIQYFATKEREAFAARFGMAASAEHNLDTLEALSDIAANSKALLRDDADAYSQLLQTMAGAAGVEEVFLPAREVVELLGDAKTVEGIFPTLAGKVDEASAGKQKLAVPIAEFILGVHRSPDMAEALRGLASVDLNGMNASEAKQFFETQQEELTSRMEDAAKEAADADTMRDEVKRVREMVDEELGRTKLFTRRARRFYTDLRTAFYVTQAQRTGMSPTELYAKYPLKLATSEETQSHDTYDQDGKIVTDTPAFKQWFGESKVVDAEGKPLVMYHGTRDDVQQFDTDHPNRKDEGWLGKGVYVTSDTQLADVYANAKRGEAGANVMPLFASISNPYYATVEEKRRMRNATPEAVVRMTEELKEAGHDGVIVNLGDGVLEMVAFDPTQVKSAIANRGTFDRKDANILNQKGFKDEEGYTFAQEAAVAQRARLAGAGEEAGKLTDDGLREAVRATPYGWRKGGTGSSAVATWRLAPTIRQAFEVRGISTPDVVETTDAAAFLKAVTEARGRPSGAAVNAYSEEEYKGMRLFVVGDGAAGFALKGDDIVSVFKNSSEVKGAAHVLIPLAVQLGGRRLDAFDTVLPVLYASHGFKAVARVKFSDEHAPDGWSREEFGEYNDGRPDVVYMAYDPAFNHEYARTDGEYVSTPEEGAALQTSAIANANVGQRRLEGADYAVDVDGRTVEFSAFAVAEQAARDYMLEAGLPYNPPGVYVRVDEDRARRIAAAYDRMLHAPDNPEVRAAYKQLAVETIAQYRKILETGLKVEFIPAGEPDPYGNPRNVILDVVNNNHIWVFSTREGFGSDASFDPSGNPLMEETEFEISGQKALVNDLFRVVHDYFGHVKDGVGFRASGEENAWRSHWAMFSPLARKAMTTETRGQNSWLNFGPRGDKNRKAKTEDTTFADQKTGLLPDWVVNEGATDEQVKGSVEYNQAIAPPFYSALLEAVSNIKAKALTAEGWKAELKGLVGKGIVKQAEIDATGVIDYIDANSVDVGGNPVKLSAADVKGFVEANGITIEETLYGGEAEQEFGNVGIDFGDVRWETDEPDPAYIEENAVYNYFDSFVEAGKKEKAEELEVDVEDLEADVVAKIEEKASTEAYDRALQDYYEDEESPQSAVMSVELPDGSTEDFVLEYAFGDKGIYWPRKSEYIFEGNYNSTERDVRAAIIDALYENDMMYGNPLDMDSLGTDGPAVYYDYSSQAGGVDNYRELLLSLPVRYAGEGENFDVPHFGDNDPPKNVVAHVRFTVRQDAEGKDTLFIEELQSDWAQHGRDSGFDDSEVDTSGWRVVRDSPQPGAVEVVNARGKRIHVTVRAEGETDEQLIEQAAHAASVARVPAAPFVKVTDAWITLLLKRIVRWASENGHEQVAIIGGQESFDRYPGLTEYVDTLKLVSNEKGTVLVASMSGTVLKELPVSGSAEVANLVGKTVADRLYEAGGVNEGGNVVRTLKGSGLKLGAKGMLSFYGDEAGAGVGKKPDGTPSVVASNLSKLLKQLGGEPPAAVELQTRSGNSAKYLGFKISEKMRDLSINKGLPLFQGADRRGSYSPETGIIELSRAADLSTFLHESGHQFLDIMFDLASRPGASQAEVDDMLTVLKWFGVPSMEAWAAMTLEQRRPHHEKWAEGFEKYLMTSKAPSTRLAAAFRAFGQWLKRIYGKLKNEVPPEVSAVMNRMLASDEEIASARADVASPLFSNASEAGMTDEEWLAYKADDIERTDDARDMHQRRRLRDLKWLDNAKSRMLKNLQRQARSVRKGVRAEVAAELAEERVYKTMEFVRSGKVIDDDGVETEVPHKLSIQILTEMYAGTTLGSFGTDPAKWESLGRGKKNGLLSSDGLHPDVVAGMFGYPSGDEMVRDMLNAAPFNEKVEALTDRRMLEEHADLADDAAIEQSAIEALHGDAHLKFLATEHNALADLIGSKKLLLSTVKGIASTIIGRTPVADIKPYIYVEAERRAARAAEKAMKSGDLAQAAEETRNRMVNAALTKTAYEAVAGVDKRVAAMRAVFGNDKKLAKYRDMNMVNTARALISAHEVTGNIEDPLSYVEKVKAYDPDSYKLLSQIITPLLSQVKPFRRMSLNDFTGFSDIIAQLWHLSRRTKQMDIDGKMVERSEIISALREKLSEHEKGGPVAGVDSDMREADRRRVIFQSWGSTLRRVESWVSKMDGGPRGPFRKYLWNPVRYSIERYRTKGGQFMHRYRELLKTVDIGDGRAIAAPEIGYTFTRGKASLLHALLHIGNDSNKRKLLLGRGWGTQDDEGNLDSSKFDTFLNRMVLEGVLTKADFDFAQGVWDLLEEMKPDAQKAHKSVYGYYFNEITARPFKNAYGEYRGGYVPAVTDSYLVADAAVNEGAENLTGEGSFMWPSTGAGFTKARVEYNKPLALDLRLIASHIDKAARFTYIQPAIQDVARLLKQSSVRSAMERVDITAIPDMLLPWLMRSASQTTVVPSDSKFGRAADGFFRWSRSTAGLTIMFANVVNTLQQFTGLSISMLRADKVSLTSSLLQLTRNPIDTHKFIRVKSEFMANRNSTMMMDASVDIKKILEDKNLAQRGVDFTRRHGYIMQTFIQSIVDNVVWLATYRDAMKIPDVEELEAVRMADAAVRETQGSFSPEDVSRIETGSAFWQMFMMFAGYFNMQANILATDFSKAVRQSGLRDKYGRLLYVYIFGFMIPAVVADAIVRAFQPDDGDDDDEDNTFVGEVAEVFFMPQVRTAAAMVPGVGMVATTAINRFDGKWYNDRLTTSPVFSVGERAASGAEVLLTGEIFDDELKKKEVRDVMTLLSVMTGVPVFAAAGRPAGYLTGVESGEIDPTGAGDVARGLVMGR